jgi:archaellum biogenesis ATPase FlaH
MTQQIDESLWKEFQDEFDKKPKLSEGLKINQNKYPNHKTFWDKFLSEPFPKGEINKVLEKNLSVWACQNNVSIKQIKAKYDTQGWNPSAFMGWVKKVINGEILEYNPAEVYLWCKNNNRNDLAELIKDKKENTQNTQNTQNNEWIVLSDSELQSYIPKQTNWLIEPIIKAGGITIIAGKRSTFKSWFNLSIAYSISNGIDFLQNFKTTQGNILYLDRENQISELKIRSRLIKKGLNVSSGEVYFISESNVKIDNPKDVLKLETIIKEKNIKLLIVDVYRRVISFDENDATQVSHLFCDLLKPLTERTGVAIVLIHHEKKGRSSGDNMDMLRGSSDLANYVDGIIQMGRRGENIILTQSKNRAGKEIKPFSLKVVTDEIDYFKFVFKGKLCNKEEVISQAIINWIIKEKKSEFTYTEALKHCENLQFKKSKIVEALKFLVNEGILNKEDDKSPYIVEKKAGLEEIK